MGNLEATDEATESPKAASDNGRKISCRSCSVTFSNNTNLNKHMRSFHPGSVKCEICDEPVRTSVDQHLKAIHQIELEHHKLTFSNEVDFQLWKVEEEKRSGTQFVSTSGTKRTPACVAKRYFICRRSGKFRPQSLDRSRTSGRLRKARGSIRCGVKCPARITLTVDHSGKYLVDYQATHYGHDGNSKTESIAEKSSEIRQRLSGKRKAQKTQETPADQWSSDLTKNTTVRASVESAGSEQRDEKNRELEKTPLPHLESLWRLRTTGDFQRFIDRLHIHFDREKSVLLVSEVGVVMSAGTMRPCLLSSLLFYESQPPSIFVRGVELPTETFQVGDLRKKSGFFGLICAILNAPKCPGVADQGDVFLDNASGYLDTAGRWRHENCSIFSPGGVECVGCASLKKLVLQVTKQVALAESLPKDLPN